MKIKNKIRDLGYIFYECKNLKNIDELKYLNTKYSNNYKNMFHGCSSLSDIYPKSLILFFIFILILFSPFFNLYLSIKLLSFSFISNSILSLLFLTNSCPNML